MEGEEKAVQALALPLHRQHVVSFLCCSAEVLCLKLGRVLHPYRYGQQRLGKYCRERAGGIQSAELKGKFCCHTSLSHQSPFL